MHPYTWGIPSYGMMIVVALIAVNTAAMIICSRRGIVFYDFLILEGYAGLGAIIGSKLLFLCTVFNEIDWSRLFSDHSYFNMYMKGGFVFFGGLLCALPAVFCGSRIHGIRIAQFLDVFAFVIPLGHGIGRIGCFLAGCCYGIESDGPISVVFPAGGFAPSGSGRVPTQLIEAISLFAISIIVLIVYLRRKKAGAFPFYLIAYSIIRFVIEFYRGDAERGIIFGLSTSQWICVFILLVTTFIVVKASFERDR